MRSDLTPKARIRDAALRLFADHGFDAVTVRRIAATAEVSPALVLHHYGSKEGLRAACDDHILGLTEELMPTPEESGALADRPAAEVFDASAEAKFGSFAEVFPDDSPVLPYLRRMLLADDERAREVLRGWHRMTVDLLTRWRDAGVLDPGPDPEVRAALLLAMDLGGVLLRDPLTELLGFDPLGSGGIDRWGRDAYSFFSLMLTDTPPPEGRPS
ncbi:TetR/AcrR family transcriptional regulator [uncultured Serinicoccus sp.]|uniref:TetR/AcrR family transcriptional regulator n=1 Tax=uncultured Serinicoccus sp. TaxID=735514 RepID=UPI00260A745D|nr:TetR/AcrR family transcriptional regulator [uncultured Serinicoccus sp.]